MRLKRYINEKYAFRVGTKFEVFVNPSKKEMMELVSFTPIKKIRFTALNDKKKVYVWTAFKGVHANVEQQIPGYKRWDVSPNTLEGVAELKSGKFVLINSDQIVSRWSASDYDFIKGIIFKDWSWLNKYIDVKPYFKMTKEELKKYGHLDEKYIGTIKYGSESKPVFVNPSFKEMKEAGEDSYGMVRWGIDLRKKKLYVWNGYVMHEEFLEEFFKWKKKTYPSWFLGAEGEFKSGKIHSFAPVYDMWEPWDFVKIYESDLDWIKKWVEFMPKEIRYWDKDYDLARKTATQMGKIKNETEKTPR